ncbi:hypothetical protein [Candidatus Thiothrix anitrata]|uniref:Phospholipase A2 domain-containing protein n=1 Tax=Candidatus Thiothrix anitrata TaxID=2823902 RepID=A0ABX7X105_9GAMM|nr:hypothetical protein [Candidatus Thiothrix anitrata]QTR48962.1 hypothetical protein J8380_11825 [Candidatus Thiothrix anitrata]
MKKIFLFCSALLLSSSLYATDFSPHFGPNCGTGATADLVPDELCLVSGFAVGRGCAHFYKACKIHDKCYDTLGSTKEFCDKEIHQNLKAECGRAYNTIVARPAKIACEEVAINYYRVLRDSDTAQTAYENAQRNNSNANSNEDSISEIMSNLYREVLGREPDPIGLKGKISEYQRGDSIEVIRDRMARSDESKNNIRNLYKEILCREPDDTGFKGKLTELSRGDGLAKVTERMRNSDERMMLNKDGRCQ